MATMQKQAHIMECWERENNKTVWKRGGCSSNSSNSTIYIDLTFFSAP